MGRANAGDSMQAAEAAAVNRSGRGRQQRRTQYCVFDVGGSSLGVFAQSVRLMTVGLRAVHHDCFRWLRATNEQRARNRGCINHSRPQKIASSTLEPNSDLLTLTHVQGYGGRDPRWGGSLAGAAHSPGWAGPGLAVCGRQWSRCSAGEGKGNGKWEMGRLPEGYSIPSNPFTCVIQNFSLLTHSSHPSSLIPPPFSQLSPSFVPPPESVFVAGTPRPSQPDRTMRMPAPVAK
jgi:hypothetical protein